MNPTQTKVHLCPSCQFVDVEGDGLCHCCEALMEIEEDRAADGIAACAHLPAPTQHRTPEPRPLTIFETTAQIQDRYTSALELEKFLDDADTPKVSVLVMVAALALSEIACALALWGAWHFRTLIDGWGR